MAPDTFVGRLACVLALAGAGCQSVLGPSPLDGPWTTHEFERFTLLARPGSFADASAAALAAILDDQYRVTVGTLGLRYAGHITGVLHDSAAEARQMADRSGTAYPETESFKAVCVPPVDGNLVGLLAHEANHVILFGGLGRAGTRLMLEGLPSAVLSERSFPVGRTFLAQWTARNAARLPAVADLADDATWLDAPEDVAYNASASFLAYLIERHGPEPLKQLYGATSPDFAARFATIYGRSLDTADGEWRAFVGVPR